MKKLLILASLAALSCVATYAADTEFTQPVTTKVKLQSEKPNFQHAKPPMNPDFNRKREEFEKKLKLTDEQKIKAKELHKESFEKMKPTMEQMKTKRQEFDKIKNSDLDENAKQEKIRELHKEIRTLDRQAHEIRQQNMKDFEGLLDKKQTKTLNKMKKEGRKEFEKNHKRPPAMGKFGNGEMQKIRPFEHGPMIPPPKPPVKEK